MSLLDALFETSSVYFHDVNERAAHIKKKTAFPVVVDLAVVNL